MTNYKDMTKEELIKALKEKEEEVHYLSENINNKEIEISNLKEEHKQQLESKVNEISKAKDKDMQINTELAQNKINEISGFLSRRENELNETINLLNNVVTCVDAFSAICKYANGEIIKKVTKEN